MSLIAQKLEVKTNEYIQRISGEREKLMEEYTNETTE
jgi:hypothetical protein